MKLYLIIPVVVLALVIAGGVLFIPAVESPRSQLDRQIDQEVEKAQRILHQYNAATPTLQKAFAAAASQPAEVDDEEWRSYQDLEEGTPFAIHRDRLDRRQQELVQATRQVAELTGGNAYPPTLPGSDEAYRQLLQEVQSGHALLDRGLGIVRNAINLSAGSGESEVSGRNNPSATRLQAILLYHKADLLRREAGLIRAKANLDRRQVERMSGRARELQQDIAGQKLLLAGGTARGKVVRLVASDEGQAQPQAAQQADATARQNQQTAPDQQVERPAGAGLLGNLSRLAQRLRQGGRQQGQPEPAEQPQPDSAVAEERPAVAEDSPEAAIPEAPTEAIPSLPERIAGLQKTRSDIVANIDAAKAELEKLAAEIADLEARHAKVAEQARQTEVKMIEAEYKGANSSDPEAVQAFVNEYRKLAEAHRKAAREAAILEEGSIRNSRSASADPEEIMSSPLVAVDESKAMAPERGLVALRQDQAVVEAVLEASNGLLAEVDQQIEDLNVRRQAVEARGTELEAAMRELLAEIERRALAASGGMIEARRLEAEALELAEDGGPAQAAVGYAQSAARNYQNDAAKFIRSENPVEAPERKLTDMAADQFTLGHAAILQGDLKYLVARIHMQRGADLKVQAEMLEQLAALGVQLKLEGEAQEQQPEEGEAGDGLAAATDAQAAESAAAEALKLAAESAREALDLYAQVASQLKDLWVVHANIAAVHTTLAALPRVDGDKDDHVTLARETYGRAIQGRENRPEYAAHQRVYQALRAAPEAN